jgi:hypothetical protein
VDILVGLEERKEEVVLSEELFLFAFVFGSEK